MLRIRTFVNEDLQVFTPAYLFCTTLGGKLFPILFLLDTGATVTTILGGDAERMEIDFAKLVLSDLKAAGIGGLVDTYELHDVIIALEEEGTRELIYERIEKIDALKPEENGEDHFNFSLMGTDFLRRTDFNYRGPTLEI